MDHMMSARNTYPPDAAADFHSPSVDFFSSQGSSFSAASYGQQSSVNPQGSSQPAYGLSTDLQQGHSIAQSYQTNMSDGQMANSFMYQNHPQPLSDHFYTFPTPTQYQQKHQPAASQLIQNPASIQNPPSPCHNQSYSVGVHQSQNSQFVSMPAHPHSPQMSPRHFAQHQAPQMMIYNQQKNQQIPSSPNQQHRTSPLVTGNSHPQRLNQSPKQVVSKQQNNSKDRTFDAQFYANQILQRNDSSGNNMQKSQASISKFCHTAQSAQFLHNGRTDSDNKVNGDSQLRNIQGSHYGNSMKTHSSNLNKPSVFLTQSLFEHINTSAPLNLQQSRYESIVNNSQRIQKASPCKHGVSYMPEVTKSQKYTANFILPGYNSNSPSSSKTPPNRPSPDPSSGAFAYVQNMHYKPRNLQDASLDNRASEKVISRNTGNRSAMPIPSASEHLESHFSDLYSNSYALPSIAALVEFTRESNRQHKVSDNTSLRSNKSNGQMPAAQKNSNETVSPVHWFKNQDSSLASSFQSDIEAMQADIASYAVNKRMSKAPVRASPASNKAAAHRSAESHVSGPNGLNQTAQVSEISKAGNVSRTEQQPSTASSPVNVRRSKADALAAIQIKQELVDSISRYKSASPNNSSTASNSSSTKAVLQTGNNKAGVPPSAKDVTVLTQKISSSVKDPVKTVPSQPQLDFNTRRHSAEANKTKQSVNASPSSFVHTAQRYSPASECVSETTAGNYLRQHSMVEQTFQNGQQVIQTRRNTTPSSLDRYTAAYSPDERQNMDRYRPSIGAQGMGTQSPAIQNSIHHLVEQVQNMQVPYQHIQQQQYIADVTKNKHGDSANAVRKTPQEQHKSVEETVCVKQPPYSTALSNGSVQQTAPAKNMMIKMEQSDSASKSINTIGYVILHDYKLICLKSSSETLLLLCQFQVNCFPDRSLQNVNMCIDQTFHIKRKLLSHQDTDKVVLFLKKTGFQMGNVLQTITLNDARRVYHYLYGITNCTLSSCITDIFISEVDHNTEVSSLCASSVGKEMKKETSSDDSVSGQFVPAKPQEKNITARKEDFQSTVNHNGSKPVNSQMFRALPPSSKNSLKMNQIVASEGDMDSDDSDDLILVEASEDPHVIRWSGSAPKVGGICNTIIGQLRSYVHENERFLVVDDLCRVFGTTDFYDGVEKENIILYSCCQEIAQFLNAMHKSFPSLQSQHHSLVKEKDIGIHIIDSDYAPGANGFDKDKMGSQTLKRFLCKQEIVDDDCSSPKQPKLGHGTQLLESNKQQSSKMGQSLLLNHCQSKEDLRDLNSSGLQVPGRIEQHSTKKLLPKVEEMNRVVQCTENEVLDSFEDTSQLFVVSECPNKVLQCISDQILEGRDALLVADAQKILDAQVDKVNSSERTVNDSLSSHSFKETTETTHNTNQIVSEIGQHVTVEGGNISVSVTGESGIITGIAYAPANAADMNPPASEGDMNAAASATDINAADVIALTSAAEMNAVTSATDMNAIASATDMNALASATDMNAPASATDMNALASATDLNALVSAIDMHAPAKATDMNVPAKATDMNAPANAAEMSIVQPGHASCPPRQMDAAEEILPLVTDEQNSTELLLAIKGGENNLPHLPSLTTTAGETVLDMHSPHPSMLNSNGSASEVDYHEKEKVDKSSDNSEVLVNTQTEDIMFSPLSSFEDLIVSNPTSSILKKRVERLKYIFETRKSKNLPLPRITLDSRLNLHLLTDDSIGFEDKSSVSDTSATELGVERSNSTESSSECSSSKDEKLNVSSDITCDTSAVIQGQENFLINFLERSNSPVVTNCREIESSDVRVSRDPSLSVEQQTSALPQEKYRNSVDFSSQDAVVTPFAKYFPKRRRPLDDSGIMLSRNIDPSDILPSQCWKEYSKLFQEHRALQGLVGDLQKSIAHLKAEKEKSEKVTKYYEGVISDITSTIKYGGEDTPVVIDDDYHQRTANEVVWASNKNALVLSATMSHTKMLQQDKMHTVQSSKCLLAGLT